MSIKIAPSVLSADFSKMGEEIATLKGCGADLVHLDVMDGVFVKNITFGPKLVEDCRKFTDLPFDAHLMIVNPEKYVGAFADAGADIITVHKEACGDKLKDVLMQIKGYNKKCGAVINPNTPVKDIQDVIEYCDMILCMSVYPGFGGQKFIDDVLFKIEELSNLIIKTGKQIDIQVDGGINLETVSRAKSAGANVIVAGSTVFNAPDRKKIIEDLRNF
ncbi:MAG: ribulose-phosphate 3-epimerase [Clostridia bacterium]|nr:ribulose-phosphate 3-epimerase [Clostridia bacterium]